MAIQVSTEQVQHYLLTEEVVVTTDTAVAMEIPVSHLASLGSMLYPSKPLHYSSDIHSDNLLQPALQTVAYIHSYTSSISAADL